MCLYGICHLLFVSFLLISFIKLYIICCTINVVLLIVSLKVLGGIKISATMFLSKVW